jgi:3-hydroxyacyl-CoA dehydrogenase
MTGDVTYIVRDGVAIVEISHPPENALGPDVRRGLSGTLTRAVEDSAVNAVVVRARGPAFGTALDPDVIDPLSQTSPTLRALCDQIEQMDKPVVAALHGLVLGPAADVALACHYRVAQTGTRLGFPDVQFGLTPSGGGALRLPHLVGAKLALEMLVDAKLLTKDEALQAGAIDRAIQDKAGVAAFAFARELITRGNKPVRAMEHDTWKARPDDWLGAIAAVRKKLDPSALTAVGETLTIVEAALILPEEEAKSFDDSAFAALMRTDQAKALSRLGRAERRAAALPHRLGAPPRDVKIVGVLGSNSNAIGLSTACLSAGLHVVMATEDEGDLEESYARIGEYFDAQIEAGAMTDEAVDDRLDALTMVCGYQAFGNADIVLDLESENTEQAIEAAGRLDPIAAAGAVLASMSTAIDLAEVARSTSRPGEVLGLRFFGNAHAGTGAEILAAKSASRHAIVTLFSVLRALGKLPVVAFDDSSAGGIAARMSSAIQRATDALVAMGARPQDVETALLDWGLSRAIFTARQSGAAQSGPVAYSAGANALAVEAPETPVSGLTPDAIRRTCLAAAVNEGARLVADGIALLPSDIDVLSIHGLGFRRRTGGPMTEGDLAGLLSLRRALPRLGKGNGIGGAPHPLLDDLIKNGRGFEALDRSAS